MPSGEERNEAQLYNLALAEDHTPDRRTKPSVHLTDINQALYAAALHSASGSSNKNRPTSLHHVVLFCPVIIGLVPAELEPHDEHDLAMMRHALRAAEKAAEKGEVPVGAVVAREDKVLATAANERESLQDPTAHAELLALRRAATVVGSWRLGGCTLYSTLEPCPMCAGAAHAARISRLVYSAPDPKAGFAGTLHDLPGDSRLNHTFPTKRGLLEAEAAEILREFFKTRRKTR